MLANKNACQGAPLNADLTDKLWTGCHSKYRKWNEDSFVWAGDGSSCGKTNAVYENWADVEPNNYEKSEENCMEIQLDKGGSHF